MQKENSRPEGRQEGCVIMDELIPKSVDEAAGKLMNPTAENAGKTFGDLWYLVFGGISFAADKRKIKYQVALETFEKSCREKIEAIPEEKLIEPDTQTATIALEESKFCIENAELRDMFSNLIASTMNSDTSDAAHPSFPQILKQMSPFDAKLFKSLRGISYVAICEYRKIINTQAYTTLQSNIYLGNLSKEQTDKEGIVKQATSITLLERLGLINVNYGESLHDKSYYSGFYNTKLYDFYKSNLMPLEKIEIIKGTMSLTDLGKQLISICCPIRTIRVTVTRPTIWETPRAEGQTTEKTDNT